MKIKQKKIKKVTKKITKKVKTKRIKLIPIPKLKKRLWKLCSEFVRLRDKNVCFTCGKKAYGSAYHAGHFIASAICGIDLRYDPLNVHGQCYHCNINLGGNGAYYFREMMVKYGVQDVMNLFNRVEKGKEWSRSDYQAKIVFYERALAMIK